MCVCMCLSGTVCVCVCISTCVHVFVRDSPGFQGVGNGKGKLTRRWEDFMSWEREQREVEESQLGQYDPVFLVVSWLPGLGYSLNPSQPQFPRLWSVCPYGPQVSQIVGV